ncbi:hypothetical protein DL765_008077 [Monosporascus sp. GIB2]|nr:hypothetical protein DL765_008077 [Monosporascus sp. GIB2]
MKSLSLLLQAVCGVRSGDIHRSSLYIRSECLYWKHIYVRMDTRHEKKVLIATITLAFAKGRADEPGRNVESEITELLDPAHNVMCPLKFLLVTWPTQTLAPGPWPLALAPGSTAQHSLTSLILTNAARMYKVRLGKWGLFKNKCKKRTESETTNVDTGEIDRQQARLPDIIYCRARRGRSLKDSRRREDLVRVGPSVPHRLPGAPAELTTYSISDGLKVWAPRVARLEKLALSLRSEDLPISAGTSASTEMYRSFELARSLFARGLGRLAGKAIRRAFLLVEDAITSTDTMLMWNIVYIVYELAHWKQMSLLRLLLDYIEKMAASKVPEHPIRTVVRALAGSDDELGDITERVWKCNLDHVKRMFKGEEDRFKRLVNGALAGLEDPRGGGEGQQQPQQPPCDGLVARDVWEFICSCELLGQCAKPEGITELEKAEEPTKKALEITDSAPDADGIRSILLRWSFEDLLERAGKLEEARLVREDNVRRAEKFLANIPDRLP